MRINREKLVLIWINLLGGAAVLGSYVYELWNHPSVGAGLWGRVPLRLQPAYTGSMLAAAVGYFLFTFFILFRLAPRPTQVSLFSALYVLILAPSALWMPLTVRMLEQPSPLLWVVIRMVLALVGLGSVGLLAALMRSTASLAVAIRSQPRPWAYGLAIVGCLAFCVQTVLLDAIVWTAYFPPSF